MSFLYSMKLMRLRVTMQRLPEWGYRLLGLRSVNFGKNIKFKSVHFGTCDIRK